MKCSSCSATGFVNRNGICRECEAKEWEKTQIARQRRWQDYKDKQTASRRKQMGATHADTWR